MLIILIIILIAIDLHILNQMAQTKTLFRHALVRGKVSQKSLAAKAAQKALVIVCRRRQEKQGNK